MSLPARSSNTSTPTPTGYFERNLPSYFAAADGDFHSTGVYGFAYRPHTAKADNPFYPWTPRVNQHPMMGQPVDIARPAGKPYLIYECNDYRPNPFRAEFPMRVATMLNWQDADGAFFFYWDDSGFLRKLETDDDYVRYRLPMPVKNYPNAGIIHGNDEITLAAIKSAGTFFCSGSVPPAPHPVEVRIGKDILFDLRKGVMGNLEHRLRHHAWRQGIRLVYDPENPSSPLPAVGPKTDRLQLGDFTEICWAGQRGYMRINAPGVKAYVGFADPEVLFKDTRIAGLNRDFVNIGIVAEDGLPLTASSSILITMVSDSTNTDFRLDPSRRAPGLTQNLAAGIVKTGGSPVLVERVAGTISGKWLEGLRYSKHDFRRRIYATGELSGSLSISADEPLFYARLTRPRPKPIRTLLVIGNSLTRHGPSESLGWKGNWGMAATAAENDFAHRLHQRLCEFQPDPRPKLIVESLLARNLHAQLRRFHEIAAHRADIVVVQIGDNLSAKDADQHTLARPYRRLIDALKDSGDPLIICAGVWGGDGKRNALMREQCARTRTPFVRLDPLIQDPANRARSEGHFTHSGVNWHPGDRGMQAIADTLWEAMRENLAGNSADALRN